MTRRKALKAAALTALSLPLIHPDHVLAASADSASGKKDRTRGLKLGLASYSLAKLPVESVIEALKQLQLNYVSLYKSHVPWDGTADECRAIAQKFKDAGVIVTGSGVIELPNDEAAVRKAFTNARAAGLPTMVCKPAPDSFPLVEKFVKEFDLKLAIHNHGPEDKVYPSPYDAWKIIQPYDKRIGLCLDVGHAARGGTDPIEAIRKCRDRLYDVHLKDSIAPAGAMLDVPIEVGRGQLNIRGILAALVEIKYPHIIAFEYEKRGDNSLIGLAESVGYVRGVLAGMSA
jgi:inosose dehydratase